MVTGHNFEGLFSIGIKDTGAGISASQIDDLFQPFNRLGAELSSIEGTGIGLFIAKQLVELMQGKIRVDSSPGNGCIFWVDLVEVKIQALQFVAEPKGKDYEAEIVLDKNQPAILVAEDNMVNQALMQAQLKIFGYKADYADNGVEALKLWREGEYDIVLTDIRMPMMDGYELIQSIRSGDSKRGKSTVIIAISANAMESDTQHCYEVGVNEVISKPVELEQLREVLKKWHSPKY